MRKLVPALVCVTPGKSGISFLSCHPCSPDEIRGGSQCSPCHPCSPDQISGGSQCSPCHPCSPDEIRGGSQCSPCHPCSPDQMSGGSSGSDSSCFISSACIESLGLPDDCEELQILRQFRDKRKTSDNAFAELVKEYYQIAPAIVAQINAQADSKGAYSKLYDELVLPCVKYIKNGQEDAAISLYTKIVRELQLQYNNDDE